MEDLTIYKAQSELKHLKNQLEFRLKQKELNYNKTQPGSKPLTGINVSGGTRTDKYLEYVIKDEELDNIIDFLQEQIKLYEFFIEQELKRLNEYDEWEQKVIYMREAKVSWFKIACSTPFSESTCKRIYRRYLNKRNIDLL